MAARQSADGILGWPTSLWHNWMGWLPDFLRVVVFTITAFALLRFLFRQAIPFAARAGQPVATGVARGVAWLAVRPEYLATWLARRFHWSAPRSFAYGEVVAGALEASERAIGRVAAVVSRSRNPATKLAFWLVVVFVIAANAMAYHSHARLPAVNWWHSVTSWVHSLHKHPVHHHRTVPVRRDRDKRA